MGNQPMTHQEAIESSNILNAKHLTLEFYTRNIGNFYFISVHGIYSKKFIILTTMSQVKNFKE